MADDHTEELGNLSDDAIPVPSGVPGLDVILCGGFPSSRIHLVEGEPGTGKTTLALQFLLEGVRRGEPALYITLAETKREVVAVARAHDWSLAGLTILELVPPELSTDPKTQQSILHTADLELGDTVRTILSEVERVRPRRIVLDSLSEIRLLTQGALRYRRQVLSLKQAFLHRDCTVLLLDDMAYEVHGLNVHSIVHGVVRLEQLARQYGAERRRPRVTKMRGVKFRGGYHDFTIEKGGVHVYPRLVAAEHHHRFDARELVTSGVAELDTLLGGGLDRGTNLLLLGPSGAGKSTMAIHFATAAIARGERVAFFNFDEARHIFLKRAASVGMDLAPHLETGLLQLKQIDPAELTPGELAGMIRVAVEDEGTTMVVLDSLGGYLHAMPEEQFMLLQMHELLTYLNQQGVVTVLVLAQHGLVGQTAAPVDMTYLSDAILLLRFFEAEGKLRRAISMVKKRTGTHEMSIREYLIDDNGVQIGAPLTGFHGLLLGMPTYRGVGSALLHEPDSERG